MRKQVRHRLLSQFDRQLIGALPHFSVVRTHNMDRRLRLYQWHAVDNFFAFVLLQPSHRSDEFTIEVAWSNQFGQFPSLASPFDPSCRVRLGTLWPPNIDYWWRASHWKFPHERPIEEASHWDFSQPYPQPTEEDFQLLDAAVQDAVEKVVTYGIPYIQDSLSRQHIRKQSSEQGTKE